MRYILLSATYCDKIIVNFVLFPAYTFKRSGLINSDTHNRLSLDQKRTFLVTGKKRKKG